MKDWLNIENLNYQTYEEYKDSKIEWLDKVPNHFKINRIKNDFKAFNGNSIKEDKKNKFIDNNIGINFIGTKDINNFKINYNSELKIPKEENFKLLEEYTPLLCIEGGSAGKKIAITNEKIHFGNKLCSFNNDSILLKKYMYYYLQSQPFQLQFNNELSGMIEGVSIGIIRNLYNIVTSKKEQLAIVKFLDEKTTIIDKKIEILKKQNKLEKELEKVLINQCVTKGVDSFTKLDKDGNLIDFENKLNRNKEEFDLYMNENEYKDSKIKWLGYIPNHFKITKFKNIVCDTFTGTTPPKELNNYDGNIKWITIGDLQSKFIFEGERNITEYFIKKSNIKLANKGDLLFSFKLTLGKVAFANDNMATNEAILVVPKSNIYSNKYLYYSMPIYILKNSIENIYGAGLLNQGLINNAIHTKISQKEQLQIVKFLDNKTQILEQKRIKREKEITLLEEYKKTLINDVVTGKIKVIKD